MLFKRSGLARLNDRVETLNDEQFAYLLVLPVFLMLSVVAFWPLLNTFEMSLHANQLGGSGYAGEFVGLKNYVEILTGERDVFLSSPFLDLDQPLSSALIVTFILTVFNVGLSVLMGFGEALIMDQDFQGRRWVRLAILIPWAVPIVIQGMIFYLMFIPGVGFATPVLHDLGVISKTPLVDPKSSILIIVMANVWKTSTFVALLLLAALQSIDRELYNVAKVAGASRWQLFRLISLPLIAPTLMIVLLFRTIQALKVYGIIEVVSSCSNVPSLTCMVVTTFSSRRFASAAAIAVITAVIIGIVLTGYLVRFANTEYASI